MGTVAPPRALFRPSSCLPALFFSLTFLPNADGVGRPYFSLGSLRQQLYWYSGTQSQVDTSLSLSLSISISLSLALSLSVSLSLSLSLSPPSHSPSRSPSSSPSPSLSYFPSDEGVGQFLRSPHFITHTHTIQLQQDHQQGQGRDAGGGRRSRRHPCYLLRRTICCGLAAGGGCRSAGAGVVGAGLAG